ncbi:hypothetical protein GCM10022240_27280 [Microbacterium kribbense]|uniref:Antitoxin VbhA domain-containing protein n=1 Tax=Microbacterium kribbense TaxID=433645 RepID=A0ABP7GYW4_9MICO
MDVNDVDAKAKWSQNRSDADRAGVIAGYAAEHRPVAADRVRTGNL